MAKIIDKPGIYNINIDEYLADPCPVPSLTRSTIKDLLFKTPCHAYHNHPKLCPCAEEKEEAKFDIGTAAHSIFLQGIDIVEVVQEKDWRKDVAKEARDEARKNGKVPLLAHQHDSVMTMVEAANEQLGLSELALKVEWGQPELTYIWKEKETWCRIRPDWISEDRKLILDYKTTSASAHPEDYARIAVNTGLDIQEAFYKRGVRATEKTKPDFVFMVQEISEPYLCSFFMLDLMFQDMGEQKVRDGITRWNECMESGKWPGFSPKIYTLEPPGWAMASWEMKKYSGGDNE